MAKTFSSTDQKFYPGPLFDESVNTGQNIKKKKVYNNKKNNHETSILSNNKEKIGNDDLDNKNDLIEQKTESVKKVSFVKNSNKLNKVKQKRNKISKKYKSSNKVVASQNDPQYSNNNNVTCNKKYTEENVTHQANLPLSSQEIQSSNFLVSSSPPPGSSSPPPGNDRPFLSPGSDIIQKSLSSGSDIIDIKPSNMKKKSKKKRASYKPTMHKTTKAPQNGTVKCPVCNRNFTGSRIQYHLSICCRFHNKIRPVWNSQLTRTKSFQKVRNCPNTEKSNTTNNWRKESDNFRKLVKSLKIAYRNTKQGKTLENNSEFNLNEVSESELFLLGNPNKPTSSWTISLDSYSSFMCCTPTQLSPRQSFMKTLQRIKIPISKSPNYLFSKQFSVNKCKEEQMRDIIYCEKNKKPIRNMEKQSECFLKFSEWKHVHDNLIAQFKNPSEVQDFNTNRRSQNYYESFKENIKATNLKRGCSMYHTHSKKRFDLVACHICKRTFFPDRIKIHEKICLKIYCKKRPVWDSSMVRTRNLPVVSYVSKSTIPPPNRWREKHKYLMFSFFKARNGSEVSLVTSETSFDPYSDYVPCPYCNRRFSQQNAERHIDICKHVICNKPNIKFRWN